MFLSVTPSRLRQHPEAATSRATLSPYISLSSWALGSALARLRFSSQAFRLFAVGIEFCGAKLNFQRERFEETRTFLAMTTMTRGSCARLPGRLLDFPALSADRV